MGPLLSKVVLRIDLHDADPLVAKAHSDRGLANWSAGRARPGGTRKDWRVRSSRLGSEPSRASKTWRTTSGVLREPRARARVSASSGPLTWCTIKLPAPSTLCLSGCWIGTCCVEMTTPRCASRAWSSRSENCAASCSETNSSNTISAGCRSAAQSALYAICFRCCTRTRPTSSTSSEAAVAGRPMYVTPGSVRLRPRSTVRSDGRSHGPNKPNRSALSRPTRPENVLRCSSSSRSVISSTLS